MKINPRKGLVLLLAAAILIFPGAGLTASAATVNPNMDVSDAAIQKYQDQIAKLEEENKELDAKIAAAKTDLADQTDYKQYLDEQISKTSDEIELKQELIAELKKSISDSEDKIASLTAENAQKYQIFKERMKFSYENGNESYLEMLFNAKDFTEFLSSAEYVASLLEYERSLMDELQQAAVDENAVKADREAKKKLALDAEASLESDKADLINKQANAADYISQLNSTIESSEAQVKKNQAADKALDASIEAILVERQNRLKARYSGGTMMWPVDPKYKVISSGYGARSLYGVYDFHLGIDIPCDYGAAVYAANAGTVVTAGYHYSYGYYVVIDHGGGVATLYAHNSSLLVASGDSVTAGQQIARAGATGSAYGNHCHFEIRVNGKTQNPVDTSLKYYVVAPK